MMEGSDNIMNELTEKNLVQQEECTEVHVPLSLFSLDETMIRVRKLCKTLKSEIGEMDAIIKLCDKINEENDGYQNELMVALLQCF